MRVSKLHHAAMRMATPQDEAHSIDVIFPGSGEMARRCRAFDWAATPLGASEGWSQSLRTVASTMLASKHPMFLWWGPELIQIYNDGYRPSFGSSGRDIVALGARGREHWAEIWPTIGPQIEAVLEHGEATWHEDQLVPIERDGKLEDVYWTYGYSPVRDDDASIQGVLVVVQETTARVMAAHAHERLLRELEIERARLAYVFQQAPSFLAVLKGPDHVFELVNNAFYQLVGHRELIGKPAEEALPEISGQGFIGLLDGVVGTGKPFIGREMSVNLQREPAGPMAEHFVDLTYLPLIDVDGTRAGVIAHGYEVTQHVLTRREAERAKEMAESANRAKGDFLALMSHELRTPLNAIGGYAELVQLGVHGPVTRDQVEALERIQKSQRHLLGLINGVLNYTRLEAGVVTYHLETVPMGETIASCEALITPQMTSKGLRFDWSRQGGDLAVKADREKLEQILLNLLSNAVKFTDRGGRVAMTCSASGDIIHVEVSDTGRGIAQDEINRVFEPFVQVDATFTRDQHGVGLGLAISRDLARGMGGDLTATSTLGEGSVFTLKLPRVSF